MDAAKGCAQCPRVTAGHVEGEKGQGGGGQQVRGCEVQDPDADDRAADMKAHYSEDEEVFYDADGGKNAMEGNGKKIQRAKLDCCLV